MAAKYLDHVNIQTSNVDETVAFFTDVIGLTTGPRPNFDFPGAWLYCGDRAVIHLVGQNDQPERATGCVDHVAFEAEDFDGTCKMLDDRNYDYYTRDVPGTDLKQIFVHEPNGLKIELNIRGS